MKNAVNSETYNEIDYWGIVLNGYYNQNAREHFSKYFLRRFKDAEANYYEADEFFRGCLKVTASLEWSIEEQFITERRDLRLMKETAKNRTIQYSDVDKTKTYEERCVETISYCDHELKCLNKESLSANLSSLTRSRFSGKLYFKEVLFIENSIIEAYQSVLREQEKPTLELIGTVEINFNQTAPEYYHNKIDEIRAIVREKFVVTRAFIEQNPRIKGKLNIGDIIETRQPNWPEKPKEAFELFKNYYSYKMFLLEASNFLNTVGSWNQRAIEDKLGKLNQFIGQAEQEVNFNDAAAKESNLRNDKQKYILLAHDYYSTHSVEKDHSYQLDIIYARYFLFKGLLENKNNYQRETGSDDKGIDKNVAVQEKISVALNELRGKVSFSRNDVHWKKLKSIVDLCTENLQIDKIQKKGHYAALFSIIYNYRIEGKSIFKHGATFKEIKNLLDIIFRADSGSFDRENKLRKYKDEIKRKYPWIDNL